MFLSRRQFLIDGLRVTATVPALACLPRPPSSGRERRVLVVVQLTGGNDGLNTVVPFSQDAYFRSRPTLAQKRSSLHALDERHGLHPALGDLGELFREGRLTIVHGVGYPNADRSHFRSLEIWHTADPEHPSGGVGWLGRLADQLLRVDPGTMPALLIGDEELPLAMRGMDVFAPVVRDEHSLHLGGPAELARERLALVEASDADGDLAFLRAAARSAYRASERLEEAARTRSRVEYPDLGLARKLQLVARLIAGGFDTRLFFASLGGFDTHARQGALHAARLEELSRSLGAFQRDLAACDAVDRVVALVFSEFGRRVDENASRGTDHGSAAPVLLLGGDWPGGLRGSPPDLDHLQDGDLVYTTDFRSVYSALEGDWLGLEPSTSIPALDLRG